MEKLNMQEMEEIEGGNSVEGCSAATLAASGLVFAAATATGPFGWAAVGAAAAGGLSSGALIGEACLV